MKRFLYVVAFFWALNFSFAGAQQPQWLQVVPTVPPSPAQPQPNAGQVAANSIPPDAIERFAGEGPINTRPFTVKAMWEIHWRSAGSMNITLGHLDGKPDEPLAQQAAPAQGSSFEPAAGQYYLKITGSGTWDVWLTQFSDAPTGAPSGAAQPTPDPAVLNPPEERGYYQNPIVIVRGDNSVGTGFLVKMDQATYVITNQHVISDNPNLVFQTIKGVTLKAASLQLASDRDLAMIKIDDSTGLVTIPFSADVASGARNDDDTVIPGNSQGGDVVVDTPGKIVGIGPVKLEVSNPIYPGNSGSPVVDLRTKQAVGVITEAEKSDNDSWLDRSSMANKDSAIKSVRYYSLRFDNVPKWEPGNFTNYYAQTHFLETFHENSMEIASFFQALTDARLERLRNSDNNPYRYGAPTPTPEDTEFKDAYRKNSKLVEVYNRFEDAVRTQEDLDFQAQTLTLTVTALAQQDLRVIQNPTVFSSFNRTRAQDELQLRNELLSTCQKISERLLRDSR